MLLLFGEFVIRRFPHSFASVALLIAGLSLAGCDREKQASGQAYDASTKTSSSQGGDRAGEKSAEAYVIERSFKGQAAPDAEFFDSAGKAVTLADFAGKPLLVNLWATWCAPCVAEMPELEVLAAASKDVRHVIAVSQDIKGEAVVRPWVEKAGLKALPIYTDAENDLLLEYNSALPTTIYYDADGKEVWRVMGALDWTGDVAAKLLAEAS